MEVTVNQQNFSVPDDCNVQVLLSEVLNQSAHGVAIAIGNNIIPKTQWESHCLKPGNQIILIKATQGG
jgi:sulfur carrier protein